MTPEAAANWTPTRLSWVAETIVPQRDKPTDLTGDVPWVRIEDFNGKYISESHSGQGVNYDQIRSMPLRVFPPKTVVTSCSCTMGATAITTRPLITNQTFIGLVPDESRLSADFLYYLMQAKSDELQALATGAIQQYLSQDDFRSMRFALPPVSIQRRIADYLDRETAEIDAFIAELSHFMKLTEERRNATRSNLFSPRHAENLSPIKRVARLVGGSGFPLAQQGITDEELPFYKVGSLSSAEDGTLTVAADSISRSTARSLGAEVLPPGSVVMAKIGAALFLRRNALLTKPGCIDNNMLGLVPTPEVDGRYLQEVLLTIDLGPIANPGAVPSLNMRWFRETRIEVPPLETQHKVMARFSELDSAARLALADAAKAMELAQERRSALISAAVTGQIDVTAQGVSAAEQLRDELEVHV